MTQPKFDTFIIDNPILFESLVKDSNLVESEFITVDVETDNKNEKLANLYGIGIAFTVNKGFYIPWRNQGGAKTWTPEMEERIIQWLVSQCMKRKLLNHNIIYDVLVLENNLFIDLAPYIYADTILMKHTIDEEMPFGLKEVAV